MSNSKEFSALKGKHFVIKEDGYIFKLKGEDMICLGSAKTISFLVNCKTKDKSYIDYSISTPWKSGKTGEYNMIIILDIIPAGAEILELRYLQEKTILQSSLPQVFGKIRDGKYKDRDIYLNFLFPHNFSDKENLIRPDTSFLSCLKSE